MQAAPHNFSAARASAQGYGGYQQQWRRVLGPNGENDITKIHALCPLETPVKTNATNQTGDISYFKTATRGGNTQHYWYTKPEDVHQDDPKWQINASALTHNDATYNKFGPSIRVQGLVGATGTAGNAIAFDVDATISNTDALRSDSITRRVKKRSLGAHRKL